MLKQIQAKLWIRRLRSKNSDVRRRACRKLGELGDGSAVEPLIQRLGDDHADVRLAACEALGRLKDPRAVEPLIQALEDDDSRVRAAVCSALGRLSYARAVELLIKRLGDAVSEVQAAACEPLDAIWRVSAPKMGFLLCAEHLTRFEKRQAGRVSLIKTARYAGCRVCGKPYPVLEVAEVVAVLDSGWEQDVQENGRGVRVNWLRRRDVFALPSHSGPKSGHTR